MKKILVPTDFSPWAQVAGDLAVQLAPFLNTGVDFLHRLYLPPLWDGYSEAEQKQFPFSRTQYEQMQDRFRRLQQRYEGHGVPLSTAYVSGDLIPAITQYKEDDGIYMIVMGSHGTEELSAKILGSNAQKVVRHAHCPVLVLKNETKVAGIKNIVFASDFKEEAERPYEWLMEFGRRMGSTLHLLHIMPYGQKEIPANVEERMNEFASRYPLKVHVHVEKDIELGVGIAYAAQQLGADMVALAHPQRSAFMRFLTGSVTEELVNQLDIPVLALNMPPQGFTEQGQELHEVKKLHLIQ
ncbi:MAG: universal stress protein [Bacteroidota bacterium]